MKKLAIAFCVAALVGMFALVGCSSPLVIGEAAEGAQTFDIANKTEADITNIAFKNSNSEEYEAGLMTEGQTWKAGATATVNVVLPEATEAITADDLTLDEDNPARDILLRDCWDIQVTFADGTTSEMHNVLANDIASAELWVEDGKVYMLYTSKESGEKVDSKLLEADYADAQAAEDEAKAKAEEEAQKKAEEEAAAAAAAQAAAAESYNYSGGGSGGGSVSQSGDSCVEGGVQLR